MFCDYFIFTSSYLWELSQKEQQIFFFHSPPGSLPPVCLHAHMCRSAKPTCLWHTNEWDSDFIASILIIFPGFNATFIQSHLRNWIPSWRKKKKRVLKLWSIYVWLGLRRGKHFFRPPRVDKCFPSPNYKSASSVETDGLRNSSSKRTCPLQTHPSSNSGWTVHIQQTLPVSPKNQHSDNLELIFY